MGWPKTWQYSRCVRVFAEKLGRVASLHCWQPETPFAFFLKQQLILSLVPTRTSSFLSCFPAECSPACAVALECSSPGAGLCTSPWILWGSCQLISPASPGPSGCQQTPLFNSCFSLFSPISSPAEEVLILCPSNGALLHSSPASGPALQPVFNPLLLPPIPQHLLLGKTVCHRNPIQILSCTKPLTAL